MLFRLDQKDKKFVCGIAGVVSFRASDLAKVAVVFLDLGLDIFCRRFECVLFFLVANF